MVFRNSSLGSLMDILKFLFGCWLDSSLQKTGCHWFSVQSLCHLAYLSLFSQFTFLKNGFLTAVLTFLMRLGPFLMRLGPTVHGSTESSRSICQLLWQLLYWISKIPSLFETVHLLEIVLQDFHFSFCPPLVLLPQILRTNCKLCWDMASFQLNSSLGMTLLEQKYYFIPEFL